jgi:hypothetical protein
MWLMETSVLQEQTYTTQHFEVLTAVAMKVAIFGDIGQCSSHLNQRYGKNTITSI